MVLGYVSCMAKVHLCIIGTSFWFVSNYYSHADTRSDGMNIGMKLMENVIGKNFATRKVFLMSFFYYFFLLFSISNTARLNQYTWLYQSILNSHVTYLVFLITERCEILNWNLKVDNMYNAILERKISWGFL